MSSPDRARWLRIGMTVGGMVLLGLLFACKELPNRSARVLARTPGYADGDPMIRVAILRNKKSVVVEVDGEYRIYDADSRVVRSGTALSAADVRVSGGLLRIGSRDSGLKRLMLSVSSGRNVKVNGLEHEGELIFIADGDRVHVVSVLPLEQYLCGVLLGEVPVGKWHDDALLAQAVASRTYALFQMARRAGHEWDVTNTQASQVYKSGHGSNPTVNRIVNATRGTALTLDGMVIPAYFHSSCGGHTEANGKVFNESTLQPLSGSVCGYCRVKSNKFASWTKTFRKNKLAAAIRKRVSRKTVPRIQNVRSIEVTETGASGRAVRVKIRHAFAPFEISADHMRQALGAMKLPSTKFTITETRGSITFSGAGWGHGVGLCQFGAEGLARSGHDHRAILNRYYPDAHIKKVY